jgi:hypothetical protein
MDPKYRIYYGKYPDTCTNEIPNTHIRSVNFPSYRIEPGKPGEPKIDSYSFVLENFNQDGSERYDTAWFETNSRSSAEGATIPFQLFFRIIVADTNIDYVGVMDRKKPGRWNETVEVSVKHILTMALAGNKRMLGNFSIKASLYAIDTQPIGTIEGGYDLENVAIDFEMLDFTLNRLLLRDLDEENFETDLRSNSNFLSFINNDWFVHLGKNVASDFGNFSSYGQTNTLYNETRPCFVKIDDQVILTKVVFKILEKLFETSTTDYICYATAEIWHAANSVIDEDNVIVLPRGRFYSDSKGTDFAVKDSFEITFLDTNLGNDADIIVQNDHSLFVTDQWIHGVEYEEVSNYLNLKNASSNISVVNIVEETAKALVENLFDDLFSGSLSLSSIFDIDGTGKGKHVFFADIMQYGWMNDSIGEVLVDLAMQTNSYLFVNEAGKIVFQDRLKHDSTLPDALPSGAFELQLSDINPLGTIDDSRGFESYEIAFKDRLEINNQELSTSYKKFVDQDGEVANASLRNSKVTIGNYRTSDLGVPGNNDHPNMPVFRYSPDHASFPLVLDLEDFIPDPVTQAQRFAASFSYPVRIWDVEISMAKYSQPGIGKYCWVSENGVNNVYLIKELHPNPDRMIWGLKLQYVGVYTP